MDPTFIYLPLVIRGCQKNLFGSFPVINQIIIRFGAVQIFGGQLLGLREMGICLIAGKFRKKVFLTHPNGYALIYSGPLQEGITWKEIFSKGSSKTVKCNSTWDVSTYYSMTKENEDTQKKTRTRQDEDTMKQAHPNNKHSGTMGR